VSDRELGRKLTKLLDDLDQERQFVKAAVKESKDRQERLIQQMLDVRNEIKFGQKSLFTDSSGAAGSGEGEARAAAAGSERPQFNPSLPSSQDLDAHEDDATQRRRNSGDPSQR
jgi:hypothetical protein